MAAVVLQSISYFRGLLRGRGDQIPRGGGDLGGDIATEPRIASPVHLSHATLADARKNLVWPEFVDYGSGICTSQLSLLDQKRA